MDEWIVIDMKGIFLKSPIYQEEQIHNLKWYLIENIVQRCTQCGKLDYPYQIAQKTEAMQKDIDYEKGKYVYDQEDSFKDDELIDKENHIMVIPETELVDYHMCKCILKNFQKSIEYKKRISILKKLKFETKYKSVKKKNKDNNEIDQVMKNNNKQNKKYLDQILNKYKPQRLVCFIMLILKMRYHPFVITLITTIETILLCKIINLPQNTAIDPRDIIVKKHLNILEENMNLNLSYQLNQIGCVVVNIRPDLIEDRREHIILGLVWQIIKIQTTKMINLDENLFLIRLKKEEEEIVELRILPPDQLL